TVDDREAVQSFNDRAQCWHAGSRKYNEQSIGIEICVNEGGNFKKAVENAAELTRQLMRKYSVPASRVIQHNQASGKDCPTFLRRGSKGILWSDFLAMVKGGDAAKVTPKKTTASKSKAQVKPKAVAKLKVDGKWGSATTRELQRALGTTADGIISSQPRNSVTQALYGGVTFGSKGSPMVRALQRKVGAKVDGKLGAETVRKLQAYLGTVRDGKLSRPSLVVKELQRRLNNGKF